jgi:hypothetical protein
VEPTDSMEQVKAKLQKRRREKVRVLIFNLAN